MAEKQTIDPRSRERGHEVTDLPAGRIMAFLAALGLACLLFTWAAAGVVKLLRTRADAVAPELHPLAEARQVPPAPRLQIDVRTDVDGLRARSRDLLETYGWVDRDAGVVRIPVERAMNLLAERGLPVARTAVEDRQ